MSLYHKAELLKANIARHLVGKDEQIGQVLIALLAGGHVLLEDVPGVGKTTLAKALAASLDCSFARIQFTPDTLPSDVTGMTIYHSHSGEFETVPGAVVHQIVLADEINRTSPKTQASLLEAMEEGQVTIDGTTIPLPEPFMVIATENPMDSVGTYPLPEAQLDRFMMKLSIGYPSDEDSMEMANRFLTGALREELKPVLQAGELLLMRKEVEQVAVHQELVAYASNIVKQTRLQEETRYGASPRAVLVLLRAVQACAYLQGRDYAVPEDVSAMARLVLPHRLVLTVEAKMARFDGNQVLDQVLRKVQVPGLG